MPKVLGATTDYPDQYTPEILEGIPRQKQLPGVDIWTCYEVSWCDPTGKPHVAIAQMHVPTSSPNIVESKSLKLYLNSFNAERLTKEDLITRWKQDLANCIEHEVELVLYTPEEWHALACKNSPGHCIDSVNPNAESSWVVEGTNISETLVSHLFRSLCPVTSQPDWATIEVSYTGKPLSHPRLLAELIEKRNTQGFHESCIETLFEQIQSEAKCEALSVTGYFTRRGGIDITPIRSTVDVLPGWVRQYRQ